ncbi:MAG: secondary thiamine-phosphate synthase enzyme YjbQ [Acidobacteriota bacterium]
MEAMRSESAAAALDCHHNKGMARVFSRTIEVKTDERMDLVNLTPQILAFAEASGIKDGYVQLSCLHTTAGLFINEWQDALLADIKKMLGEIVPQNAYYRHNDPEYSDCDRHNADSHLRNIVLGHNLSIPIDDGDIVLGRWQSVILAEFDGPNRRRLFLQAFGI